MKQLTKQEYQKRALLVQKLASLLELNQTEPVAAILSYLVSPIGTEKHPYRMSDNEFIGVIEDEIKQLEYGTAEN